MSVEKECLSDAQIDRIIEVATKHSEEARKFVLSLIYTGIHISILCDPKYDLKEEQTKGKTYISWKRTKKTKKKEAYTSIPKHKAIDFNVEKYAKEIQKRTRKKSRQYFWKLAQDIGAKAGIRDVSPMTFRHTCGVIMLDMGVPHTEVQRVINCSDKVLKQYLKYSKARQKDVFERVGWME